MGFALSRAEAHKEACCCTLLLRMFLRLNDTLLITRLLVTVEVCNIL